MHDCSAHTGNFTVAFKIQLLRLAYKYIHQNTLRWFRITN